MFILLGLIFLIINLALAVLNLTMGNLIIAGVSILASLPLVVSLYKAYNKKG
jgi:hypothetical protein